MDKKIKDSKFLDTIYKHAEAQKEQMKRDIRNYKPEAMSEPDSYDYAKESKFFDAINLDAQAHMAQISREIEEYRNRMIEQATEQGLQDAYDMIREDVTKRTAAIVNGVAARELELRRGLFAERQTIREEVFAQARGRLRAFTRTEEYTDFLSRSLDMIAESFGDNRCTVYTAPFDEDKRGLISGRLPGADIVSDSRILIGGIKAHCPSKGVMLDDTLDTRLADQSAWFTENSGLKVV